MTARIGSRVTIGALITAVLLTGTTSGAIAETRPQPAPTVTTDQSTPAVRAELDQLNAKMRTLYGESRNTHLAQQPLVLVGYPDHIEVRQPTGVYDVPVDINDYTYLKDYAHLVLGGYGVVWPLLTNPTDAQALARVAAFRQDATRYLALVDALWDEAPLRNKDVGLLRSLTEKYVALAEDILAGKLTDTAELRRRISVLCTSFDAIPQRAAELHAKAYRKALRTVRKQVTREQWDQAVSIVAGAATARRDNLETAMFIEAFGRDALGTRIMYAENAFAPGAALNQLGIYLFDAQLAADTYGDSLRMWRDLFGDYAADIAGGHFLPVPADSSQRP